VKVTLKRVSGAKFEASNERGHTTLIDGPPKVGGHDEAMRPMEMVLVGLAGCTAVDVLMILNKQRQSFDDLDIHVEAERADAVPAVFTDIHMRVEASGDVLEEKLKRAVDLSIEKYCSVAKMLMPAVKITWDSAIKES
jgi:putative redox protein